MSEAVEYRLKRNRQFVLAAIALMLFVAGAMVAVFAYLSPVDPSRKLAAVAATGWLYLGGSLVWIHAQGMAKDGLCRRFMNWIPGSGYADPPLESWEEEIESRNGFSTVDK